MADWQGLAVGTVAWGAGFGIVTALLGKKKSGEFCNRCVSMVHVFVAAYLCMASVSDWSRPLDGIGGPSSALQVGIFSRSAIWIVPMQGTIVSKEMNAE